MIAPPTAFEPQSSDPLPNCQRVYVSGSKYPELRVPLREISLSPTRGMNGRVESNPSERVYDCSGPWGDPQFEGNVAQGLPADLLKQPQIREAYLGV